VVGIPGYGGLVSFAEDSLSVDGILPFRVVLTLPPYFFLWVSSARKITTENPYASYVSALVNRIQCSDWSGCECNPDAERKRDSAQPQKRLQQ
jgi:hypothetical protein